MSPTLRAVCAAPRRDASFLHMTAFTAPSLHATHFMRALFACARTWRAKPGACARPGARQVHGCYNRSLSRAPARVSAFPLFPSRGPLPPIAGPGPERPRRPPVSGIRHASRAKSSFCRRPDDLAVNPLLKTSSRIRSKSCARSSRTSSRAPVSRRSASASASRNIRRRALVRDAVVERARRSCRRIRRRWASEPLRASHRDVDQGALQPARRRCRHRSAAGLRLARGAVRARADRDRQQDGDSTDEPAEPADRTLSEPVLPNLRRRGAARGRRAVLREQRSGAQLRRATTRPCPTTSGRARSCSTSARRATRPAP